MPASEGKTVKITLNVGGNNNGSRVNVTPPHVAFEQYDEIVVASNGKYVGTLTHNGNVFEGEITGATENQPLYFYFFGNKDLQYTMDGDNIVGCTLNISDQSAELPCFPTLLRDRRTPLPTMNIQPNWITSAPW